MSFSKQITSNLFYLSITELLSKVLLFVYTLHLSRVLGAEGFGKLGFAGSVLSFLIIFVSIGMDSYGTRAIAQKPEDQDKIVNQIFSLRLVLSVIIYGLFLLTMYYIDLSYEAKLVTVIYCLSLFGHALNMNWVFLAIQKMRPIAIRQVILSFVTLIAIYALVKTEKDTVLSSAIISIGVLLSLVLVLVYYHLKVAKLKILYNWNHFKIIIYSSFPIGLSFLITTIYNNASMYFLGVLIKDDFYQTGIMNAAQKLLLLGVMPSSLLQQAFFPTLSGLIADNKKREEVFALYLKVCVVVGVITSVILFTYADKIILIQFGEKFADSIPVLRILSINLFMIFLNMLYTSPLVAWNHEKVFLKSVIFSAILNVSLNYYIIPKYQAIGVSYVIIFTEIVTNLFMMYYFKKLFGYTDFSKIVKYFAFSIIAFIPGFILYEYFSLIYISILVNILAIIYVLYSNNILNKDFVQSILKKKF